MGASEAASRADARQDLSSQGGEEAADAPAPGTDKGSFRTVEVEAECNQESGQPHDYGVGGEPTAVGEHESSAAQHLRRQDHKSKSS